jgi:uncharacterized protein (TIGR02145 family)
MKKFLFLIAIFCVLKANAQNYLITFNGTGASATVNSVKIENLTKNTSLTINGGDVLQLTVSTGVNSTETNQTSGLKIYPNPMTDNSILQIYPPEAGNAVISVLDLTGKSLAQTQSYLENFRQDFRLAGLKNGFYIINVEGNNFQFSEKLVSNGKSNGKISLEKINIVTQTIDKQTVKADSKGNQATVTMEYTTGDRLKFTGISGNFSTVITDIPASNKVITFNFIACTDGDNNNYPVVEIGTQVWMAENLKTTKYNEGTDIPYKPQAVDWVAMTSPAFCWYNNDAAANKNVYGALYNWFAASTANLCPVGWHVPSEPEWTILTTYLDGLSSSGGKMKETGTSHWASPNTGATNSSGFSGLPGGYRGSVNSSGNFDEIRVTGEFWSTTISPTTYPYSLYLDYWYARVVWEAPNKTVGFSIRCLKN